MSSYSATAHRNGYAINLWGQQLNKFKELFGSDQIRDGSRTRQMLKS